MRKSSFSPMLTDVLEERVVLSAVVAQAQPAGPIVVTTLTQYLVNHRIDQDLDRFIRDSQFAFDEYTRFTNNNLKARQGFSQKLEDFIVGNFNTRENLNIGRLRTALKKDVTRLPLGRDNLNPTVQTRLDQLFGDLNDQIFNAPAQQPATDSSLADTINGARTDLHQSVNQFVNDGVANGTFQVVNTPARR